MRGAALLALAALPLAAHVISFSSGEMEISGTRGAYELRMPLYEISHMAEPRDSIFRSIRFSADGRAAELLEGSCREDADAGAYVCRGVYDFGAPVERLEVECRYHAITVPNHVHLLRAVRGDAGGRAVLDLSFPTATVDFEPPSAAAVALAQAAAGAGRALTPVELLFLACLVLAARSRKELGALAGMFLAGQVASTLVVPLTEWNPPVRFVEAATALTVAYMAAEILLLPKAGSRWAVAGVLGGFHGLYFAHFLRASGYSAGWVMAGSAAAQALLLLLLALLFHRAARWLAGYRPVPVAASCLFAAGAVWFIMRLAG